LACWIGGSGSSGHLLSFVVECNGKLFFVLVLLFLLFLLP
jgi:hypothetical protein